MMLSHPVLYCCLASLLLRCVWVSIRMRALPHTTTNLQASDLQAALPSKEVLQQMAAFTKQSSVAIVGTILADMAAADAAGSGSTAAIMLLPGHDGLEYSAVAKSCCCCNKMEDKEVRLMRLNLWAFMCTVFWWIVCDLAT